MKAEVLLNGSDADKLAEIAKLEPIQYDRLRESLASDLGIRVSVLDQERAKRRKTEQPDGLDLTDPEPWPEEVDGAELLDALAAGSGIQHRRLRQQEVARARPCSRARPALLPRESPRHPLPHPRLDRVARAVRREHAGRLIHPAPKEIAPQEGDSGGAKKELYMGKVTFLRPRNPRACAGCGTNLERAPSHWTCCRQCFSYSRFRAVLADHPRVMR